MRERKKKTHSEQSNRVNAIHPGDLRQYPLFPVLRVTRYHPQIRKNSIIVTNYSWKRENKITLRTHSKALYARLPSVESFLSGHCKQQALKLERMSEGLNDP